MTGKGEGCSTRSGWKGVDREKWQPGSYFLVLVDPVVGCLLLCMVMPIGAQLVRFAGISIFDAALFLRD